MNTAFALGLVTGFFTFGAAFLFLAAAYRAGQKKGQGK